MKRWVSVDLFGTITQELKLVTLIMQAHVLLGNQFFPGILLTYIDIYDISNVTLRQMEREMSRNHEEGGRI